MTKWSQENCVLRRLISSQPPFRNEFFRLGEVALRLEQTGVVQIYGSLCQYYVIFIHALKN